MSGATIDTVIPTDGRPPHICFGAQGRTHRRWGTPRCLDHRSTPARERSRRPALGPHQGPRRRSCQRCRGPPTGDVGGTGSADLPGLPLDDLLARGRQAIATWAREVAADEIAVRTWWTELSGLLNGGAVDGTGTDGDPLGFTVAGGGVTGRVLLRIGTDAAATGTVLRPALSLSLDAPTGSPVDGALAVEADLASITLGAATGAVALPNLTAALHFGSGTTLLVDTTMPATGAPLQIRTARAGVTLTARRESRRSSNWMTSPPVMPPARYWISRQRTRSSTQFMAHSTASSPLYSMRSRRRRRQEHSPPLAGSCALPQCLLPTRGPSWRPSPSCSPRRVRNSPTTTRECWRRPAPGGHSQASSPPYCGPPRRRWRTTARAPRSAVADRSVRRRHWPSVAAGLDV